MDVHRKQLKDYTEINPKVVNTSLLSLNWKRLQTDTNAFGLLCVHKWGADFWQCTFIYAFFILRVLSVCQIYCCCDWVSWKSALVFLHHHHHSNPISMFLFFWRKAKIFYGNQYVYKLREIGKCLGLISCNFSQAFEFDCALQFTNLFIFISAFVNRWSVTQQTDLNSNKWIAFVIPGRNEDNLFILRKTSFCLLFHRDVKLNFCVHFRSGYWWGK